MYRVVSPTGEGMLFTYPDITYPDISYLHLKGEYETPRSRQLSYTLKIYYKVALASSITASL